MNDLSLRDELEEFYGSEEKPLLFSDGHDNAIIGVISRCGQDPFVVYEYRTVIKNFMKDGMTAEEAEEWVSYNWTGAWVGTATPAILEPCRPSCLAAEKKLADLIAAGEAMRVALLGADYREKTVNWTRALAALKEQQP